MSFYLAGLNLFFIQFIGHHFQTIIGLHEPDITFYWRCRQGYHNCLEMDAAQQGSSSAITAQFVMPWFMGAAFIPKFDGEATKFIQWRAQVEVMLRAQGLSQQQQADFVLGALEGNAKRELQLISPREKDTGKKILDLLQTMYAQPISKAQLRASFFNCKQKTDETVNAFILRLRELFYRWQESDQEGADEEDDILLDQFMVGLRKGPIRQELSRQMRRQDGISFKDACKEARALAHELQEDEDAALSNRVTYAPQRQAIVDPDQMKTQIKIELKEELLGEIKTEIKEQLKVLSSDLITEIRAQFSTHNQPPVTPSAIRTRPSGRTTTAYQWDPEGRPICRGCGSAGHVQRRCPQRSSRSQDF